jgi:16S rRNA C967 or C1407 C5-methylase (RsmB/RsmF family)
LLDAPCSGNFCIEPDYFAVKDLEGIRQRARLQRELLKSAYRVLKAGGTLVYSTCSLEPEEDELVIDWFLGKYEDMALEKIDLPVGEPALVEVFGQRLHPSLSGARRLWPHKTRTQGFFVAKLRKR